MSARAVAILGVIAGAVAAWCPAPAVAACVPNFDRAVACFGPRAAAAAYRIVGRDPSVLARDNVRAVLERGGCVSLRSVAAEGRPILEAGRGRIPDLEGWVEVLYVLVSHPTYGDTAVYVAADWLSGTCEPFRGLQ